MTAAAPVREVVLPNEGFVRLRTVLAVYPVSERTWYRGVREGKFPRPIRLSPGVSVWRVEDIRALLARAEAGDR